MPAPRKKTAPAAPSDSQSMDGLENLVTGQGGHKDSRAHGVRRWTNRRRTHKDLAETYEASWLAGKIVDVPAFEMTRERREIELDDPKMATAITKEEARLGLWEKHREGIQWADLFGGGCLLVAVDGTGDWAQPLIPETVKLGALKWVHALDPTSIIPELGRDTQLVIDPTSASFMKPEFYQVIGAPNLQKVHHTRIIRYPGLALPWFQMQQTLWWGGSRINRLLDSISDSEQVIGGVADLITESKIDVFGIKNLMSLLATPDGEDRVMKRIAIADKGKSIYNAIIMDAEETYEQKESQLVQGMANIITKFLEIVSAAADIPVTRLLGTAAKGLNSTGEGDLTNFYDMIDARRENYLRPRIDELDQIFLRSTLGSIPDDFSWSFAPLWQMSETEQADVDLKRAQTAEIYMREGVIDPLISAKQLKQDGTYVAIDDEFIQDLEDAVSSRPDPWDEPEPPPVVPGTPTTGKINTAKPDAKKPPKKTGKP